MTIFISYLGAPRPTLSHYKDAVSLSWCLLLHLFLFDSKFTENLATRLSSKAQSSISKGLELRCRDSGNAMRFSFFTIQVFSTYPENYDTKESFCFLNRGAKAKFFLADKAKNNSNMTRISFLLKQLCCCCLEIRFFSCNSFQLYVLSFCALIHSLLLNVVSNPYIIIDHRSIS